MPTLFLALSPRVWVSGPSCEIRNGLLARHARARPSHRSTPMATSGCSLNIKIGEIARPSTYKAPQRIPDPTNHDESWRIKWPHNKTSVSTSSIIADATSTAQAWISHPANKIQLPKLQSAYDADMDGVINRSEFRNLLQAAGDGSNADQLFDAMDIDGDGVLVKSEIKALGQDPTNRARRL